MPCGPPGDVQPLGRAPGAGGGLRVAGPGVRPWTCRRRRPRRYRGSQAPRPRPGRRARCRRACWVLDLPASRRSRVRVLRATGRVEVVAYPAPSMVVVRLARRQHQWCPLALDLVGDPDPVRRRHVRHSASSFPQAGFSTRHGAESVRPALCRSGPPIIRIGRHCVIRAFTAVLHFSVPFAEQSRSDPAVQPVQSAAPPGLPEAIVRLVALLIWRGLSWKPERSSRSAAVRRALTKLWDAGSGETPLAE